MRNKKILLCSLLIAHCSLLFAGGNKDAAEQNPINNEWLLCVTQFDYSQLQPSQRIAGNVITRSLVNELNSVSYRLRISHEYAYYESYAWWQAVNAAAKALSQKQDERSLLLYRGDPDWRYRMNIKRIDNDIEKLKEALAKKEAERPLVNNEPLFKLVQANVNGNFPDPPKPGSERRFCQNQKADAFLLGAVREFHGRFIVTLKLYVLYANDYVYEDDIIFSMDDVAAAVDEITGRLTAVLSGNKPAVIAVNVDPPEAQVLINRNFAGRGEVEAREHPPGMVTVAVTAEGYMPELAETELIGGLITEIDVKLSPMLYSDVQIGAPGSMGVSLYQGALYVGEAPFNLRIPIGELGYVTAEAFNGQTARIVFPSPDMPDESYDFSLKLKQPPLQGQNRVNKARGQYYWSWGATWMAIMLAWGANGMYNSYSDVISQSSSQRFYDEGRTWYYLYGGSLILLGATAAYNIFQLVRYLYTATQGATPIAKPEKK